MPTHNPLTLKSQTAIKKDYETQIIILFLFKRVYPNWQREKFQTLFSVGSTPTTRTSVPILQDSTKVPFTNRTQNAILVNVADTTQQNMRTSSLLDAKPTGQRASTGSKPREIGK